MTSHIVQNTACVNTFEATLLFIEIGCQLWMCHIIASNADNLNMQGTPLWST